jgi:hypothetical protein
MARPMSLIQSDLDRPVLFRTTTESVYRSTTDNGEIWLRADEYFRRLEDKVRNDELESASAGKHQFPLNLNPPSSHAVHLTGNGHIAESPKPHYILSLHGTSIVEETRKGFGGFTFGIRNIDLLARHIFEECRKQITCNQWNWDQVRYQHSALRISEDGKGAAIQFGDGQSRALRVFDVSPFRKRPIPPFTQQDEWRIVMWSEGYLKGDSKEPLIVRVPPSLFYRYLEAAVDSKRQNE